MEKTDYKQITIDALKKAGANMDNLAFRYHEKKSISEKNALSLNLYALNCGL